MLTILPQRGKTLPPNESPGYDTKLHLKVKRQDLRFQECGIALHCHYRVE